MEKHDLDELLEPCRWCNGTGNDGGGYNACPDCESTGYKGGRYAMHLLDEQIEKGYREFLKNKKCELCELNGATTQVDYRDVIYYVCEQCKALAESE